MVFQIILKLMTALSISLLLYTLIFVLSTLTMNYSELSFPFQTLEQVTGNRWFKTGVSFVKAWISVDNLRDTDQPEESKKTPVLESTRGSPEGAEKAQLNKSTSVPIISDNNNNTTTSVDTEDTMAGRGSDRDDWRTRGGDKNDYYGYDYDHDERGGYPSKSGYYQHPRRGSKNNRDRGRPASSNSDYRNERDGYGTDDSTRSEPLDDRNHSRKSHKSFSKDQSKNYSKSMDETVLKQTTNNNQSNSQNNKPKTQTSSKDEKKAQSVKHIVTPNKDKTVSKTDKPIRNDPAAKNNSQDKIQNKDSIPAKPSVSNKDSIPAKPSVSNKNQPPPQNPKPTSLSSPTSPPTANQKQANKPIENKSLDKKTNQLPDQTANISPAQGGNKLPDKKENIPPGQGTNIPPAQGGNKAPDKKANLLPDQVGNPLSAQGGNKVPDKKENPLPGQGTNIPPAQGGDKVPDKMDNSLPDQGTYIALGKQSNRPSDQNIISITPSPTQSNPPLSQTLNSLPDFNKEMTDQSNQNTILRSRNENNGQPVSQIQSSTKTNESTIEIAPNLFPAFAFASPTRPQNSIQPDSVFNFQFKTPNSTTLNSSVFSFQEKKDIPGPVTNQPAFKSNILQIQGQEKSESRLGMDSIPKGNSQGIPPLNQPIGLISPVLTSGKPPYNPPDNLTTPQHLPTDSNTSNEDITEANNNQNLIITRPSDQLQTPTSGANDAILSESSFEDLVSPNSLGLYTVISEEDPSQLLAKVKQLDSDLETQTSKANEAEKKEKSLLDVPTDSNRSQFSEIYYSDEFLKTEIEGQNNVIAKLETDLANLKFEFSSLSAENNNLTDFLSKSRESLKEIFNQTLETHNREIASLRENKLNSDTKLSENNRRIQTLEHNIGKQNEKSSQRESQLLNEITKLTESRSSIEHSLGVAKDTILELNSDLKQTQKNYTEVTAELEILKRQTLSVQHANDFDDSEMDEFNLLSPKGVQLHVKALEHLLHLQKLNWSLQEEIENLTK